MPAYHEMYIGYTIQYLDLPYGATSVYPLSKNVVAKCVTTIFDCLNEIITIAYMLHSCCSQMSVSGSQ